MKKGSQSRKCSRCHKIIFWIIPNGRPGMFGEQDYDHKDVIPWVIYRNRYLCRRCHDLVEKEDAQ